MTTVTSASMTTAPMTTAHRTTTIQRSRPTLQAPESMSIRELLIELASLEDHQREPAGAAEPANRSGLPAPSDTNAATAAKDNPTDRELAIRHELRKRRLELRHRS